MKHKASSTAALRASARPASHGWCLSGYRSILLLLVASACGGQVPVSDFEKRQRIDQMYADASEKFPEVESISAEQLRLRLAAGEDLILVDIREPAERAVSTLRGALTLEQFRELTPSPQEKGVITFCTVGYRSGLAAADLAEDGFQVQNLAGSLLSWTHEGGELVDSDGNPTQKLHVYGSEWDLAAEGYETVW